MARKLLMMHTCHSSFIKQSNTSKQTVLIAPQLARRAAHDSLDPSIIGTISRWQS
jgi:hypothetical protein